MSGLYIHVPFCVKKCAYCDFYSITSRSDLIGPYVDAVLKEAAGYRHEAFQTLYLGGGTPSLLGTAFLPVLLSGLYRTLDLSGCLESTIEVNPESATPDFLKTARLKGIDRLSIGIQSINDTELQSIGRVHNGLQARITIMEANRAGFKSISADLILGLPGQTWNSLRFSLETVTGLGIQHLSLYCLSLEPGTPLALKPPENIPSEDVQAELYEQACAFLDTRGFIHYEISNFTLPGFECQHNLNYWQGGEYLGLGPAAASHLKGKRFKNKSSLEAYSKNPTGNIEEIENLPPEQKAAEEAMLRLRLLQEGLNIDQLSAKFGQDNVSGLRQRLNELVEQKALISTNARYVLSPDRVLTSNPVFSGVLGN